MVTRLRRPSNDQSSRGPLHHIRVEPTASFFTVQRHASDITTFLADGHLVSWRPLRVLPMTSTQDASILVWCRARRDWTSTEWSQVVFSDESRFNFNSDNRPRGERLNPAFAL
ncbi:transposable element Tcb2 transposase [Trichonephila clavipes]|nr:transposable element Tcb2 transposase [Trichonephila clavipes]